MKLTVPLGLIVATRVVLAVLVNASPFVPRWNEFQLSVVAEKTGMMLFALSRALMNALFAIWIDGCVPEPPEYGRLMRRLTVRSWLMRTESAPSVSMVVPLLKLYADAWTAPVTSRCGSISRPAVSVAWPF